MPKKQLVYATSLALLLVAGCATSGDVVTTSRTTIAPVSTTIVTELPEISVLASDGLDVVIVIAVSTASPLNLQARSFLFETGAVKDIVETYATDLSSLAVSANRADLGELVEKALRVEDGFEGCEVRIVSVMIQNV